MQVEHGYCCIDRDPNHPRETAEQDERERMRRKSNRRELGCLFEIAAPVLAAMHWCCVAWGKCWETPGAAQGVKL